MEDWDDVDSEDELVQAILELPCRNYRDRLNSLKHFSDEEFKIRYRFEKETVINLLHTLGDDLKPLSERGLPLSPMDQLLVLLRFLATGSFQVVVGDLIHIHKSSVCRIIKKMSNIVASLRKDFIYMPRNENEVLQTKGGFYDLAQFPNVIGAIDCTHVKIKSPGGAQAELFRNRKGYFSINVQAVCNSKLQFQEVTARWPGSVHDSTIFRASKLRGDFERGRYPGSYLLGDGGYTCGTYLLTPLSIGQIPLTQPEKNYNRSHIQTRNPIERCFGVLKSRFPCLGNTLRTKIPTTLAIIVAAMVLHNIALLSGDMFEADCDVNPDAINDIPLPPNARRNYQAAVRTALINTVFNR